MPRRPSRVIYVWLCLGYVWAMFDYQVEDAEATGRAVRSLYSLITEKQDDDEFVLQLLFAFYRLLQVKTWLKIANP